jgi:hypothetical protein
VARSKLGEVGNVLQLAMLAGVGVVLYYVWQKLNQGAAALTAPAANLLYDVTHPNQVVNVNSVTLPTGEVVTVDAIVAAGGMIDGAGNFSWGGVPYQIAGSDPVTGNYLAKRIVT